MKNTHMGVEEVLEHFNKYVYSQKQFDGEWYVVAKDNGMEELKICKINRLKHPKAVATAIADSLNRNTKYVLVDLI